MWSPQGLGRYRTIGRSLPGPNASAFGLFCLPLALLILGRACWLAPADVDDDDRDNDASEASRAVAELDTVTAAAAAPEPPSLLDVALALSARARIRSCLSCSSRYASTCAQSAFASRWMCLGGWMSARWACETAKWRRANAAKHANQKVRKRALP